MSAVVRTTDGRPYDRGLRVVSMRFSDEEIAWLDAEVARLNATKRKLGRPKYAYGRADVVRDLRRRVEAER